MGSSTDCISKDGDCGGGVLLDSWYDLPVGVSRMPFESALEREEKSGKKSLELSSLLTGCKALYASTAALLNLSLDLCGESRPHPLMHRWA